MVQYEKLGFESEEQYHEKFMETLLNTNHQFDYFVNWEKVYDNVKKNLNEISLLNGLSKVDKSEIKERFKEIVLCYPEVVPILPSILAIRYENKKRQIVEILDGEFKEFDFNDETYNVEDIVYFSEKTGLLDLFNNINDLYDYLIGTEVGLDTNSRKNRSGTTYEKIIEDLLKSILEKYPQYNIQSQSYVKTIGRNKRLDFVITKESDVKIIIECNYYNNSGSKPIETAHAYENLQKEVKKDDLTFIWITDGKGWKQMEKTLKSVSTNIDYLLNYNLLKDKFEEILKKEELI